MSDTVRIVYVSRPDATPEAELAALAAVYKFVLFDAQSSKGELHDVTNKTATALEGVNQDKEGNENHVCR